MKKTLAILLALLAAASIALASCEKEPENNNDGWDDDNEYVDTKGDSNDTVANDDTVGETENKKPETEVNNTGWVATNDTVYAGVNELNIRTTPDANAKNVYKQVNVGEKLNRTSTNGKWDKVTFEGNATEYYVLHAFISETDGNFIFTDCEDSVLTLKAEASLKLYTTPFEIWDDDEFLMNNVYKLARVTAIDGEFKKIEVSSNNKWLKVTIKGTVTFENGTETFDTEKEFYLSKKEIDNKRVDDSSQEASTGSNSSVGGGNG